MKMIYAVLCVVLTLFVLGVSLGVYSKLPDRVPTHWDIRGQVDAYGSKQWVAFLTPAVMLGLLGLFAVLPRLSPKPFAIEPFQATYGFIVVLVLGLMGYIHILTLLTALSQGVDFVRAMLGGMYLFFALLGNVLGKVRRNFYVGVRVPWTIANERVWNDTHRVAAWLFVAGGLIGFVLAVGGYLIASLVPLFVAVVVPVVYSFLRYQQLERRGEV